jgi:hypothetical protein
VYKTNAFEIGWYDSQDFFVLFNFMKGLSIIFSGILASFALITNPAFAQQMFPAGGTNSTSCPSGSSYVGSGYCKTR